MTGTLANVAVGSGLKILGVVAGRLIDGYFRNKEQNLAALTKDREFQIRRQSGNDTADDWTKLTRRGIAWMVVFTVCFILAHLALNFDRTIPMLVDAEHGIFGWVFGGTDQKVKEVAVVQVIMYIWPLLEVMFGFYFTKVGEKS